MLLTLAIEWVGLDYFKFNRASQDGQQTLIVNNVPKGWGVQFSELIAYPVLRYIIGADGYSVISVTSRLCGLCFLFGLVLVAFHLVDRIKVVDVGFYACSVAALVGIINKNLLYFALKLVINFRRTNINFTRFRRN